MPMYQTVNRYEQGTPPTPEQQRSSAFYRSIGYPQYAGKYAAPNLPPGAKIVSVQEETRATATYASRQLGGRETGDVAKPTGNLLFKVEVPEKQPAEPRMVHQQRSAFGPSVGYWDPATGKQSEVVGYDVKTGEQVLADVTYDGQGPSPAEARAMLGFTAASVVAAPIMAPKLLLFEAGGVVVGEAVKYGATGEHLTGEEAVYSAGAGLLAGSTSMAVARGVNQKFIHPRISQRITASYEAQQRANIKALETGFDPWDVPETNIWRPTTPQRLAMKITGAKVNFRMAPQQVAASSYSNSAQFMGGVGKDGDAFDFAISPKSSFLGLNKGALPTRPATPTGSKLPMAPVMMAWREFKEDLKTVEFNAAMVQKAKDRGIPSSLLEDQGPLSFDNYPVKLEYAKGRTVPAAWRDPFQEALRSHRGMNPLWENTGAKPPTGSSSSAVEAAYGEGYSVALKTAQRATPNSFTTARGAYMLEDQLVLNYPEGVLLHPPILGAKTIPQQREITPQRMASYLGIGQTSVQRSALTQGSLSRVGPGSASMLRQPQILREETIQEQQLPVPQIIGQTPKHTPPPRTITWAPPSLVSGYSFPGFKFESGGSYSNMSPRVRRSRKALRIYPVLDPAMFGGLLP